VRIAFRNVGLTVGGIALLSFVALSTANAQNRSPSLPQVSDQPRVYRTTGSRVAIGRSIHVAYDEEVTDALVVIGGSVRVDGRVRDGLVVVGGNVELGSQADVRGDVVVVGGRLAREQGAQLWGSVSDITFGDWDGWSLGGFWLPTFDFGDFGRWIALLGAVFRIALLALLMVIVLVVARAPVARVGRAAAAEPGRAFVLGFVAELLFVPALIIASIGLIVTIIGIPLVAILVPLAFLAALSALLLGFTGLACRLGEWVEDRLGWPTNSAFMASAIGLILIVSPTMLARVVGVAPAPISYGAVGLLIAGIALEFIVWTIGLGAALMTGFGRWSTAPPPVPRPAQTVVPVAS